MTRFGEFTDEEAVLIALGLTHVLLEGMLRERWTTRQLAEKFPLIVGLMDDLGERFDVRLDPELVERAKEAIGSEVVREANDQNITI